jgi:hypothetical protein
MKIVCWHCNCFSLDGKKASKQYFCKSIISYMCCPKENFDYCYLDNHMHYNKCLMEMIWLQRNFMIAYDDTTTYLLSHQCMSIKFTHWALDHFVSMSMKDWLGTNVVLCYMNPINNRYLSNYMYITWMKPYKLKCEEIQKCTQI